MPGRMPIVKLLGVNVEFQSVWKGEQDVGEIIS